MTGNLLQWQVAGGEEGQHALMLGRLEAELQARKAILGQLDQLKARKVCTTLVSGFGFYTSL